MGINLDHLAQSAALPQQPQVIIGVDPTLSNVVNSQALLALAARLYGEGNSISAREAALAALEFQEAYNEVATEWDAAKKVAV